MKNSQYSLKVDILDTLDENQIMEFEKDSGLQVLTTPPEYSTNLKTLKKSDGDTP